MYKIYNSLVNGKTTYATSQRVYDYNDALKLYNNKYKFAISSSITGCFCTGKITRRG